jgi:hypothetical protein
VYGGPHRRWNLQLLHQGCNSAKGKKITAGALELADAHGVRISADIGHYRAGVRRRAAIYAVRAARQLGGEARDRALAQARNLTVFFPEARVRAVIRQRRKGPGPLQPRLAIPAEHSAQRTSDDQRNRATAAEALSCSRNSGHFRSPRSA